MTAPIPHSTQLRTIRGQAKTFAAIPAGTRLESEGCSWVLSDELDCFTFEVQSRDEHGVEVYCRRFGLCWIAAECWRDEWCDMNSHDWRAG